MKEIVTEKLVATEYTGPEAFVDNPSNLVWIVGSVDKKPWGETLKVHTVEKPTIHDGKVSFRGKILLDKDQELKGSLVGDLIPYLTTKVDDEIIEIVDIPGSILESPVDESSNAMFGKFITFKDIKDDNAFILYAKSGGAAVLASDEKDQQERAIFVFKDSEEANMALITLKVYPPYTNKFFYKGAKVYSLLELGVTTTIEDEKFIYFDMWQKCVANLSHHMKNEGKS